MQAREVLLQGLIDAFPRVPRHITRSAQGNEQQRIRIPTHEFRSLALAKILEPIAAEKRLWQKNKVELGRLALQLANHDPSYQTYLEGLAQHRMARQHEQTRAAVHNPSIPRDRVRVIQQGFEARLQQVYQQVAQWCQSVTSGDNFKVVQPFLEQVMSLELSAPPSSTVRCGAEAEAQALAVVTPALPPGYTLYTSCCIQSVDGNILKSTSMQKGEADLLLAGPEGVHLVIEVKTAKGNPYLALSDDLPKLENLLAEVRGRSVSFVHTTNSPNRQVSTLPFSNDLLPVYILASADIGPDTEKSARRTLLRTALGLRLRSKLETWQEIQISDIDADQVTLEVEQNLLSRCAKQVDDFFDALQKLDILMLPTANDPQ